MCLRNHGYSGGRQPATRRDAAEIKLLLYGLRLEFRVLWHQSNCRSWLASSSLRVWSRPLNRAAAIGKIRRPANAKLGVNSCTVRIPLRWPKGGIAVILHIESYNLFDYGPYVARPRPTLPTPLLARLRRGADQPHFLPSPIWIRRACFNCKYDSYSSEKGGGGTAYALATGGANDHTAPPLSSAWKRR